jgi:predicted PurR-regulated permease PerM
MLAIDPASRETGEALPLPVTARSRLLLGIFLMLIVFALDFAREFLLPVTMAFFIALTFRPIIRKASKRGIPAWLSAGIFMGGLIVLTGALIYALSAPLAGWIQEAPEYARIFRARFDALQETLRPIFNFTDRISDAAAMSSAAQPTEMVVAENGSPVFNYVAQGAGYSIDVLATITLTVVTAAFMMASGDLFYEKLLRVFPTLADKKRALRIVYDVEGEVSSYILIVSAINLGLGFCVGAAFFALGMPAAGIWGLLAFLFNFIPYVGAIFGIALSGFMAVISFDSLSYALLVPLAYAAINGIENQFVTPILLGRRLSLNSVAILISLTFWTWQWGIAGTMLAVPILMTVKVLSSHIDSWKAVGEFLSGPRQELEEPSEGASVPGAL